MYTNNQQKILQAVKNFQIDMGNIQQAEKYANSIIYEPTQYSLPILQLVLDQNIQNREKQILIILFKKMELDKLPMEHINILINLLLQTISQSTQIDFSILIGELLQHILEKIIIKKEVIISTNCFSLQNKIAQFLKEEVVSKGNYQSAIVLCLVYINSCIQLKFEDQVKKIEIILQQIRTSFISRIVQTLESKNFQQEIEQINDLKVLLQYLELWNTILKRLLKIDFQKQSPYFRSLINDNDTIKQFFDLTFFMINHHNVYDALQTINQEPNKLIYEIKIKCLKIIMICLGPLINSKNQTNISGSLQLFTQSLIKLIIKFIKSENFSVDYLDEYNYFNRFIKYCCRYFNIVIKNNNFFQIFSTYKDDIIYNIIIPCLMLRKKQMEDFKDDIDEYINKTEIMIFESNINILEENVKSLLVTMCKKIDGVLYGFITNTILIIQSQINNQQYTIDDNITNSFTIQKLSPVNQIESFLMTYVYLKNEIITRDDLLQLFDNFLKQCFQNIITQSEIIVSRFLYFIGEFLDCIPLSNTRDQFGKQINPQKIQLMQWILEICGKEGAIGRTAVQIVDTFHMVDVDERSFLDMIASPYLNVLINLIKQGPMDKGFETLIKLLMDRYPNYLQEQKVLCEKLIESLVQKVIVLTQQENQKDKYTQKNDIDKIQQLITQVMNLLIQLTEDKKIVIAQIDTFSNQMSQLLEYIFDQNGRLKNWDEEFIQCYENIILYTEIIPSLTDKFLKILPDIVIQYNYQVCIVACFVNNILYKFPEYFTEKKIDNLLSILQECMQLKYYKDTSDCIAYLQDPILLMQVLIQQVGSKLTEQQYQICFNEFQVLVNHLYNPNENRVTQHLFTKIYGIWLNLYIYAPQYLKFLVETLEYHLNASIKSFHLFYSIYERKLLKIGMIRIFEILSKHMTDQTQEIATILNFLINYMRFIQNYQFVENFDPKYIENHQPEGLKYISLHDMFLYFMPFGNSVTEWKFQQEQMTQHDQYQNLQLQNRQEFLGKFKTKIYYVDEHELFNNTIKDICQTIPHFITNIQSHLDGQTKNLFVDNYYRTQYYNLAEYGKDAQIRRIVRYKRN